MTVDVEFSYGDVEALNVSNGDYGKILCSGRCRLLGWSVVESSGAAVASVEFASGQTIAGIGTMAAGKDSNVTLPHLGAECPQGVIIAGVTGAFYGCVYLSRYIA